MISVYVGFTVPTITALSSLLGQTVKNLLGFTCRKLKRNRIRLSDDPKGVFVVSQAVSNLLSGFKESVGSSFSFPISLATTDRPAGY